MRNSNSFIRKVIILLSGVLVTSLLFFIAMSSTYNTFYQQSILSSVDSVSTNWTNEIDRRLNAIYERVYDLSATIYRKSEVRSGSDPMSIDVRGEIQDDAELTMMTSDDMSVLFVVDTESDLYLYYSNNALPRPIDVAIKLFAQQYCLDHFSSIGNRVFEVVDVLDAGYYYKAVKLGKYIIGAMSDCRIYSLNGSFDNIDGDTCLIKSPEGYVLCQGDPSLSEHIIADKGASYMNKSYAISVNKQQFANAETVFIRKSDGISIPWRLVSIFMIADSALCVFLVFLSIRMINKKVKGPISELVKADDRLSQGDFEYKLNAADAGSSEFEELYSSFNQMSDQIQNLTIETYDAQIKRQQNQLKMLRAQVKPHTFLNAINTINNMTYTGKPEDIRRYIAAFASFTRYMMYKAKDWTSLGDELKNIESYVSMQKIRFPNSIEFTWDCPTEMLEEQIPYLILFSLVENSFKHAMTLVNTMYMSISGEYYEEEGFKGIRLIEEDNGPGFSKEAMEKLISAEADDPFTKEHLGLTNVRYSLNLIYQRDDLLRISNKEEGGARIELLIPETEIDDEITGM
ncbi:MAG: histidine kinase [Erysipelotrichaceae bacterium]|nr:histidine kinase [Erysipelotrichaceae bacterium]